MMSRAESYSTPRKAEVSPTSAVNKNNITPVAGKQQLDDIQRQVENICLTSLTRAKCGTRSTLCWKVGNISGSTELFAL